MEVPDGSGSAGTDLRAIIEAALGEQIAEHLAADGLASFEEPDGTVRAADARSI